MKTDELRRALDDLAGEIPPVDDAFRVVRRKAARDRVRNRGVVIAVVVSVIGVATFGITRQSHGAHHVIVRNPVPSSGDVADFNWTRVDTPLAIEHIATVNGQTLATGEALVSGTSTAPAIAEIDTNGIATITFEDTPAAAGGLTEIDDVAAVPGSADSLVAVGVAAVPNGRFGGAAWRSTDDGNTWQRAVVDQPPEFANPPVFSSLLRRVVVANGVAYAFGSSFPNASGLPCPSIWSSTDGSHFSFSLVPAPSACVPLGAATNGPSGVLATSSDVNGASATAWVFDGTAWASHPISTGPRAQVNAVSSSDDGYVAVGSTGQSADSANSDAAIWWSPDGATWTRVLDAPAPPDSKYRQAGFTGVVHTAAGWVAVGWQLHPGGDPAVTDATLWTSGDGQHWTETTRDNGTFEQYARAEGVGITADGVAVFGRANISGTGVPFSGDPIRQDQVLWMGSSAAPTASTGIVEGTMDEVGGPAPGNVKGIEGSLTATAADGHTSAIPVAASGRFSSQLDPGTYTIVGQSPLYNGGDATCGARYLGGDELGDTFIVRAGKLVHVEVVCSIR